MRLQSTSNCFGRVPCAADRAKARRGMAARSILLSVFYPARISQIHVIAKALRCIVVITASCVRLAQPSSCGLAASVSVALASRPLPLAPCPLTSLPTDAPFP